MKPAPIYATGDATLHLLPAVDRAGVVEFKRGARTWWHVHEFDQTLVILEGDGWLQQWDGTGRSLTPGDVVVVPAGCKHWHGATANSDLRMIGLMCGVTTMHEPVDE